MFNFTSKYTKIWKVDVRDRMVLVDLSTSKKNQDGTYQTSKYFKVKFVGACLEQAKRLEEKDVINITNGMIGKREWEKKYFDEVVVMSFEMSDGSVKTDMGNITEMDESNIKDCPF